MLSLINKIAENNILLEVDEGNLKLLSDSAEISADLLEEIKVHKQEIMSYLLQADLISSRGQNKLTPCTPAENYPLSSSQYRVWVLSQFEGGSEAYNMPFSTPMEIRDMDSFEKAIHSVIDRHEILRTVFKMDGNDEIRQWVKAPEDFNFSIQHEDFRNLPEGRKKAKALIAEDSYKPFDLENGPLLRIFLMRITDVSYVLYYNMHHIISDGWSMDILTKDILSYYRAYAEGEKLTLSPLEVQYKDYAHWQLEELQTPTYKAHEEFWMNQLSGELPLLDLPSDKVRPKVFSYEGHKLSTYIAPEITKRLQDFCQDKKASLFMGLLAAWNTLLYRYTGQKDIIIGSPVSGRDHADLNDQIGFYVNTLAFRNEIDADQSFNAFFDEVKQRTLASYDHQMYPFDQLVESLSLDGDTSRNAVFDVLLSLQNTGDVSSRFLGKKEESGVVQDKGTCATNFDLDIDFEEVGDRLYFQLIYNTSIYDREMIERLMGHFEELLISIVENPNEKLGYLNYLTHGEREELLFDFNDTTIDFDVNENFIQVFQKQVQENPNTRAVRYKENELSYSELDQVSNRLANYLTSVYDAKKGDLIVINLDRTEWLLASILAIFKMGCAYVPVDPVYPEDRKKYIIDDCDTPYVIDNAFLEKFKQELPNQSDEFSPIQVTGDDLAYIIYTSGSTGKPKGVMIEHQGMMNHLYSMIDELELDAKSVIVQNAPYTFDISVWQLLNGLLVGGATSIVDQETLLDIDRFLQRLVEDNVTTLQVVPSYLKALMEAQAYSEALEQLSYILVTGEAVNKELIDTWFSSYPNVLMVNAYGPAEASDDVTLHIMNATPQGVNVPIGAPIQNIQMFVLDENLQLCAKGIVGELCVSGIGLAKGYLNKPELTDEKFIPHPFVPGERLYKTGDLGKWLPDGTMEFVGRKDNQVKIRGHRIELGEIEYYLQERDDLEAVAVVAVRGTGGQNELAAYVTSNNEVSAKSLRSYLLDLIPAFMVPSYFVQLEELPLTSNGKVDRKKLSQNTDFETSTTTEFLAPTNETEEKLLEIWQELLGIEHIGIQDDILLIGGNSITFIKLKIKIHQTFDVALKLEEFFSHNTIEKQAKLIAQSTKSEYKEIENIATAPNYALSSAQYRVWVLSQFEGGSEAYNMPTTTPIEISDMASFEKAIHAVIDRHEILRTVFKEDEEGIIKQWVLNREDLGFAIDHKDYREEEDKLDRANAYVKSDLYKTFDLAEGPLLRMSLLRFSDTQYIFYYNMHHIISDGWSMDILARDVMTYYNAYLEDQAVTLPQLNIQYKDYANWQIESLESEAYENHKEFWLESLSGELPLLDLPTNKTRPSVFSHAGRCLGTFINPEITQGLKRYCQDRQGSLFMGLLSVLNVLFYRYTNQKDMIIGAPVSGRDHGDLKDQIGFYVNTLALRNEVNPGDSFDAFFENVKEKTLASLSHQMYPFDKLVESLSLERDTSRSAVFDILLTLQNIGERPENNIKDENAYQRIKDKGTCLSKFDLEIDFEEVGDSLDFQIIYNTDIYEQETIEGFMAHFKELLTAILENPGTRVNQLNYLSEAEKTELITTFNDTTVEYSNDKTIINLFQEQVQLHGDRPALVFEENEYTFAELDRLSDQFSYYLNEVCLVKKGEVVGIKIERSEWMLIAVLGVLKSGCAYVPIDMAYPEEKISYLESDSQCKLVIQKEHINQFNDYLPNLACDVPLPSVEADDVAYIIYTSGSTGKPKGVVVPHRSLVNITQAWSRSYPIQDLEISYLQIASFSFDVFFGDFCRSILNGGKMVIVKDIKALDFNELYEEFTKHKINMLEGTPGLLVPFLKYAKEEGLSLEYLKLLILGSDILTLNDFKYLLKEYEGVAIINSYGLTEAAIDSCYFQYTKGFDLNSCKNTPIGIPFPNIQIFILDEVLQPVGKGIVGELYIGGQSLAKGYFNRPEMTAERFVPSPFSEGETLYKSGDLGKWLPDGTIELIGRADYQVKIRGHRVELGEIESCLQEKEGVQEAVVSTVVNDEGDSELVAYVVCKLEYTPVDLQNYLSGRLSTHMIPRYFVMLESMPLTPNGKVDRKALPHPKSLGMDSGVAYVPGSTQNEKVLLEVCETVLNKERVSLLDNFFNLGGDSIKSIQVASRLTQQGFKLRVDEILRVPLLKSLAKLITLKTRQIDQGPVEGPVVLTPIQSWLFEANEIRNPKHYNQSIALRSTTPIDSDLLDRCISKLVEHHDVLRMVYTEGTNGWEQFNKGLGDKNYAIHFYDLSAEEDGKAKMSALGTELQASFDLEEGPLFKVGHFRLADGDYLALIIHHLVIDGISWRILYEDLSQLYGQGQKGALLRLPQKTDSFQNWASQLKEYANSSKFQKEQSYWEEVCKTEIPSLPVDLNNTEERSLDTKVSFKIDKETTQKLQTQVHQAYNTEINDILLTGLGLAIKEALGVDKSVLTMEGHGREEILDDIDITRTVGWFTSEFPFVLNAGKADNIENLIQVKESLRKIPNKGIGYGLFKYFTDSFSSDIHPTVEFNYLGDFGDGVTAEKEQTLLFEYTSEDIGLDSDPSNTSEVLLYISGMTINGQLTLTVSYSEKDFQPETMERLSASYEAKLCDLAEALSNTEERHLTPSDLTYDELEIADLFEINKDGTVRDVYPLSPLQSGIYFHWLSDTSHALYLEQMSYSLSGLELNMNHVRNAYQALVDRHGILRTSFTNAYGDTTLQVVHSDVKAKVSYVELSQELSQEEKAAQVAQIKELDRTEGFDLSEPCQMRLKVVDLGNGQVEFIWSHHHILMDGWCMGIIINEFSKLFAEQAYGIPANLPEVTPYARYIKWLNGVDQTVSLDYWKTYLENYSEASQIPFENLGSDLKPSYDKSIELLKVSGDLYEKMDTVCKDSGVTKNTFVQAAWGYLLSRYNNKKDNVFGAIVSGRPAHLEGIEEMVGLFINTIPVRVCYEDGDTPLEILKALQATTLDSAPHHYIELSEVQAQSDLGMDLLNHTLTFENYPLEDAVKNGGEGQNEGGSLQIDSIETHDQMSYDFGILIHYSEAALTFTFEYNANRFNTRLIQNMKSHFEKVIEIFCEAPEVALQQNPILDSAEKEQLLQSFNETEVAFPEEQTLLDVFYERIETHSDEALLVNDGKEYTYEAIHQLSNEMANFLAETYQVTPGELVGVQFERNEYTLISLLAILKLGAAYIPIDPQYPEERIAYIQENSNCKLIINEEVLETFKAGDFNSQRERYISSPNDLAYVLYTSGSTGKPKGVLIEHASLTNYLNWCKGYYFTEGVDRADFGLFTSLSFDLTVTSLFLPIMGGGKLKVWNPDMEITEILKAYFESDLNCIKLTPAHITLLDKIEVSTTDIQLAIVGGDQLEQKQIDTLKRLNPSMRIYNEYGPTEATVGCITYEVSNCDDGNILIGKPIANTKIYILDDSLEIQPIGVKGEIYIEGNGLARGYLNRPELTEDRFIQNPYNEHSRLYKTGDIGKWLDDGNIKCYGRIDNQVKLRGYRIELGEIESRLMSHDKVKDAAVVVIKNDEGDGSLTAYLVGDESLSSADLREFLTDKIPTYMLPDHYVKLEQLPLTVNGKVDRKQLLAMDGDTLGAGTEVVGPRNEVDEKLIAIWAEVLSIETSEIGVHSNFMDLGGHSLKVIRVIAKIQKEFGVKINLQSFFDNPILEVVSDHISNIVWSNSEEDQELESFKI
ncbi:amino acid adenylation domain-containing protein [Aureisphaera galaxeae]|uniref:non-ribosomal peptide synthetase n=1 Tax=Aureisphaera galaxeae TaxID=1538023 RepID=UPI002350D163|nr:non-ribosomal peptide synthetase [Aureisphaera galaxeae]MDC8004726.1 amino acid adenylation domain-containing protein [Aureisphaera galaxeae]